MSAWKSGLAAAVVLTGVTVSSMASAQVCVVVAAVAIAVTENREMTQKEAMTCGLASLIDKQADDSAAKKANKKAKTARRSLKKTSVN